jgi:4-hydroxy-tetrahydrodipicolinate synthase
MSSQPLRGVFAPTLTPVHADLSPDPARWIAFCKQLLEDGCHGLCPFGTTSEANSFSVEERMDMLEQLVAAGVPANILMPGTGCSALTDSVRLTAHAARLGCGGVLLLPPFYYKGVSDEGIFRSIAEVIERVGDAQLRVYLYHIPPVAQVGFSLGLIERLIKSYPETVVGIKDSSGDWDHLQELLRSFPGFGIFSGSERFMLQTLQMGGVGGINAVANIFAPALRKLYENWQSEGAQQMQDEINAARSSFKEYAPIPSLKQIVAHYRNDPEWLNLRPPLVKLRPEQGEAVVAALAKSPIMAHAA